MPNIKPISDLRNYSEVLRDVTIDSPVFLTKNGRGRYAIMDIQDYERVMATIKPVSYTHLDVYKRQLFIFAIQSFLDKEHKYRIGTGLFWLLYSCLLYTSRCV